MGIRYKPCPVCGSQKTVRIFFEDPDNKRGTHVVQEGLSLDWQKIKGGQPAYRCQICDYVWTRKQAEEAAYAKILNVEAYVGGYFGFSYDVHIVLANSNEECKKEETRTQETVVVLEEKQASQFREDLKRIKVLNWKSTYVLPDALDGTSWRVRLLTTEGSIEKSGSNRFPSTWHEFCKLIEETTGERFS